MTRIRTRYRSPGAGLWPGIREGLRWLLRLPLRLLRRRDQMGLRTAMERLSPRLLSAEAGIYWIEPPETRSRGALGGMREPTTEVLERLPETHRYIVVNLCECPAPYTLPDSERFSARHFPVAAGTLPEHETVRALFRDLAAFADAEADLPPAILVHCKEGVTRTPQLLCAWLVWRQGLTPEAAVRRVQEAQEAARVYVFVPDGRERAWLRGFAD